MILTPIRISVLALTALLGESLSPHFARTVRIPQVKNLPVNRFKRFVAFRPATIHIPGCHLVSVVKTWSPSINGIEGAKGRQVLWLHYTWRTRDVELIETPGIERLNIAARSVGEGNPRITVGADDLNKDFYVRQISINLILRKGKPNELKTLLAAIR